MGVQTEAERRARGSTLRSRLRTNTWSRLRANLLRHNARYVATHARISSCSTRSINASMGFRRGLPSGRTGTRR
eukprot:864313-Pleurochrysis_carterae.AAC.1